jgi:hypothetical protein
MYEIGIEEFYKNSNDFSNSPDGSGNPPDFFREIETNSRNCICRKNPSHSLLKIKF